MAFLVSALNPHAIHDFVLCLRPPDIADCLRGADMAYRSLNSLAAVPVAPEMVVPTASSAVYPRNIQARASPTVR